MKELDKRLKTILRLETERDQQTRFAKEWKDYYFKELDKYETLRECLNVMINASLSSGITNKHKKYHIDEYYIQKLKELLTPKE